MSSKPSMRSGLTLIEILVGLALLGALVAAVSTANAASVRMARSARVQLAAVGELDRLVARWQISGWPTARSGVIPNSTEWSWTVTPQRIVNIDDARAQVVEVAMRHQEGHEHRIAARVEVLRAVTGAADVGGRSP